jgi:hypothetical protein
MHLNRRLMLSLFGGVALMSMLFALYQAAAEMHAMRAEVERQALVLAESQQLTAQRVLQDRFPGELQDLVGQFKNHEHLAGIAFYDANGQSLALTPSLARLLSGTPSAVSRALREERVRGEFFRSHGEPMHILVLPLTAEGRALGAIAILNNVAFITAPVLRHALISMAQTLLIVGMTLLIIRWSLVKPLRHMAQWLKDLGTGNASASRQPPNEEMFRPIAREVTRLATSLHVARAAAEEPYAYMSSPV